ncbi:ABC transporter substrate-binding protein [Burkholderiales bacterium 8X]|nr:ABC transporter substrate-binding protein [Burkholderiales bacterium 8X]
MKIHLLKIALATAASVIGLVAGADVAAQTETLKIGVVSALTGPGSEWGLAQDGGIKIAAAEANAKGGLKVGGKTYKIEVVSYDDQYKAALALTGATRLIEQDKVRFVVGPMGSASALAIKPLFEQNKVVAIIGAFSEKALDANTRYSFRGFPTQTEFAGPIVGWLKKNKPELKTVAQLEPNDETGWFSQKLLKGIYEGEGFKMVSAELFERSLKDFQPVMTRVLATRPDIIELGTTPPGTAGLMMRQARELGFKGQFVKIGGPGVPQIVAAAGKEFAEGLICYAAADVTTPNYKELQAKYEKVLKPPMNEITVYFYDASRMLLDAMQKAGTVEDTDKIRDALAKAEPYAGIQGNIRWGGQKQYGVNQQILTPTFIGLVKNGEQVIVGRMD